MLPNRQVLVTGGCGLSSLASAELYDPATGVWTTTGSMATARWQHTATLLRNGRVLVAGGGDGHGNSFSSAELYDPATGVWTATGSMATARGGHTATLLPDGRVLVAGGFNFLSSAELYDPATGMWTATGSMATGRSFPTATLLPNGQVLVAGGDYAAVARNYTIRRLGCGPRLGAWRLNTSFTLRRCCQTDTC